MTIKCITIFLGSALLITACKNDEQQTTPEPTEVKNPQQVHDSIVAIRKSIELEQEKIEKGKLLSDSIAGRQNNMVYTHKNGLRVEWTRKSDGKKVSKNDLIMVNYSMRVAGGPPFDSNDKIGQPIPVKTNCGMMIEGWEQGLLEMRSGEKGRILIPGKLGYGENGIPNKVPPFADLIIDIEVVDIIEPIELEEGVSVYKWKIDTTKQYPVKNQAITFDYFAYTTGKDAKRYDNSFKNQQPFVMKFENDNVVDGLHQGMSVMRENEAAFIQIPANLAYGAKGLVDLVPKNTPIVYDVRIKSIK